LHRGRPDILTPGQYVRLPDNAAHYPRFSNLGSCNWRKGNDEEDTPLGEPLAERQLWTRSDPLPLYPSPIQIGTNDCIANGEVDPSPTDPSLFFSGFNRDCWQGLSGPIPETLNDLALDTRLTQFRIASINEQLYLDQATATALAVELLGPDTVVSIQDFDSSGPWPTSLIADNGFIQMVVLTGTENYQQFALQGMYSLIAPENLNGYGSNPIWITAANVINIRVATAGLDPSRPILIVGHSYGGAVAANLAILYSRFQPGRDVRIVTFGMPKPGDQRMIDLLQAVPGFHFANMGDPIPSLPPSADFLFPFLNPEINAVLGAWAQYKQPHARLVIDAAGNVNPSTVATFSITDLADFVFSALLGVPIPPQVAHEMTSYRFRLTPPP